MCAETFEPSISLSVTVPPRRIPLSVLRLSDELEVMRERIRAVTCQETELSTVLLPISPGSLSPSCLESSLIQRLLSQ